ncbi:MAG TPA: GNAT family N-acetyltransferase [Bacteroidales bacterium]|nr:GNAT family N-acetyltransferase [Bacteroidales bacterium]
MILECNSVRLRAVEPEDLELLYKWENEESNWRLSNTLVPYSRFVLKNYIAGSHKSLFETCQLRLMIDIPAEGRTVGTIDLFDFDHYNLRAGVGILVADEADRHKGYASAALSCLVKYAFGTLGLHQLWCNILEDNEESLSLFKKHGFTLCATKKEWIRVSSLFVCELMFQLIHPGKK